ncbi:unnamed protein product, partial [marine sediment metagenome]
MDVLTEVIAQYDGDIGEAVERLEKLAGKLKIFVKTVLNALEGTDGVCPQAALLVISYLQKRLAGARFAITSGYQVDADYEVIVNLLEGISAGGNNLDETPKS